MGRLGTGKDSDELVPVLLDFDLKEKEMAVGLAQGAPPKFVGIAAGAYHSLALEGFYQLITDYSDSFILLQLW